MKTLLARIACALPLLASGVVLAQNGNMMNGGPSGTGWMNGYGGYGGIGGSLLLVAVVVALVVWIVQRNGK